MTSNEVCDDGNREDGDGCSADCQTVNPGWRWHGWRWQPPGAKGGCTLGCTNVHYCGDGIVDPTLGEECDWGEKNGRWLDESLNLTDVGEPGLTRFMSCTSDCVVPLCCVY